MRSKSLAARVQRTRWASGLPRRHNRLLTFEPLERRNLLSIVQLSDDPGSQLCGNQLITFVEDSGIDLMDQFAHRGVRFRGTLSTFSDPLGEDAGRTDGPTQNIASQFWEISSDGAYILFQKPIDTFGIYFRHETYSEGSSRATLTAYDARLDAIGSVGETFGANFQFLGFKSNTPVVTVGLGGDIGTLFADDLKWRVIPICGEKFEDLNGDGVKDSDEPGLADWTIQLDVDGNGIVDRTTTTDAQGRYHFEDVGAGIHVVSELPQDGWVQTAPADPGTHTVAATGNQAVENLDFGNFQLVTLSGRIFEDLNGDGVQDGDEPGVADWTIQLDLDGDGTQDRTTTSDAQGFYEFEDVGPGTHTISQPPQEGWVPTAPLEPATHSVTPSSGQDIENLDFGNFHLVTLSGQTFEDLNGDGLKNDIGQGLTNWTVQLDMDDDGTVDRTTSTGIQGNYSFEDIGPGTYTISQLPQEGWFRTAPLEPATYRGTTTSGQDIENLDFGFQRCIELGPLCALGQFQENVDGRFQSDNGVFLGFKPTEGESFQPLLEIDGTFWFDNETIRADGVTRALIGIEGEALLDGSWEIAVGQTTTRSLTDRNLPVDNEFQPVGLGYRVSQFSLINPNSGSTADAQIELHGALTLPGALGALELALRDAEHLIIDSSGVRPASLSVDFPQVNFSLIDVLQVEATKLRVEFLLNPLALKIQGQITIPTLYNATADLAGDNFILVRNEPQPGQNKVDVVGTLSVSDIKIVPDVWEVRELALEINTQARTIGGSGKMLIPTSLKKGSNTVVLEGSVQGILDAQNEWRLNMFLFGSDELNKPLGTTGYFIQRIAGEVDHIAVADPSPVTFGGQVGATFGPEIDVTLGNFGRFTGALKRIDVAASINEERFQGQGTLSYLNGLIAGQGELTIDWRNGFSTGNGNFNLLGGLVEVEAKLFSDKSLNVTMFGQGTLKLPTSLTGGLIRLVGGTTIASANGYFQFRNDGMGSTDFVLAYGQVHMPFGDPLTLGVKVDFDGNVNFIRSAKELPPIQIPASAVEGEAATAAEQRFSVPANLPRLVLITEWDNAAPATTVELVTPDGRVIRESEFASEAEIAIATDLSGDTSKTVVIANPAAGDWTIRIPDTSGLGSVNFESYVDTAPPSVEISNLSVNGNQVTVNYVARDPDSDAEVGLYFDTDSQGLNGGVIVENLPVAGGAESFTWDVTDLPAGEYHVYALVDDGGHGLISAYSLDSINIKAWQNPRNAFDVNGDGFVSPVDPLLIINTLNADGARPLTGTPGDPPVFFDTTGDNWVAPVDVLVAINVINANSLGAAGAGEGESAAALDRLFSEATKARAQSNAGHNDTAQQPSRPTDVHVPEAEAHFIAVAGDEVAGDRKSVQAEKEDRRRRALDELLADPAADLVDPWWQLAGRRSMDSAR